jgi:hypothetical protein
MAALLLVLCGALVAGEYGNSMNTPSCILPSNDSQLAIDSHTF